MERACAAYNHARRYVMTQPVTLRIFSDYV